MDRKVKLAELTGNNSLMAFMGAEFRNSRGTVGIVIVALVCCSTSA